MKDVESSNGMNQRENSRSRGSSDVAEVPGAGGREKTAEWRS